MEPSSRRIRPCRNLGPGSTVGVSSFSSNFFGQRRLARLGFWGIRNPEDHFQLNRQSRLRRYKGTRNTWRLGNPAIWQLGTPGCPAIGGIAEPPDCLHIVVLVSVKKIPPHPSPPPHWGAWVGEGFHSSWWPGPVMTTARKIPDAVWRREGPCGPPHSEGDKPPPYGHADNGIFICRGETRIMSTWW